MSQAHQHHHHDHSHADGDNPYYLDQMCLVALSAVFGAVCLSLYFWRDDILKVMLSRQFHPFVLVSGVILVILAVLRGISLWIQVGKDPVHADDHEHPAVPALASLPVLAGGSPEPAGSCGDHGHGHCGHDHHDHHHDGHTHAHDDPGHKHAHSHGDHDHDHGWAPWRYVVLLVPVILFLLGIPSKPPFVVGFTPEVDHTKEALQTVTWIAMGTMPLNQAGMLMAASGKRRTGDATTLNFATLEGSASRPDHREYWAGKIIRVKGQFVPNRNPNNKRVFSVGRFSINCCRQDAVQLNVPIIASEEINHIKPNEWVQVTGEIQYRGDGRGSYQTQLIVLGKEDVVKTAADPDPYISAAK